MGKRVWAAALGATLFLGVPAWGIPAWAAPNTAENLDFTLKVESISWTKTGFVVKAQVENRTGSPEIFLHHEADRDDAASYVHTPSAMAAGRQTFMLKGQSEARTSATLAFGLGADQEAGLLIVGETRAPHRQVAIALKDLLPIRSAAAKRTAEAPDRGTPDTEMPSAETPSAEPDVIQSFTPPHASFGRRIVLKEGKPGPQGDGWVRLYTELPDITLEQLAHVLERPAQIWRGEAGLLYVRNIGGKRALAVEVRNEAVISARYVTPETLGQVMGPRTRYPKRVYMGRP